MAGIVKVCKRHGELTADRVYLVRGGKSGLSAKCMECARLKTRAEYYANYLKRRKSTRAYYARHQEDMKARHRQYRQDLSIPYVTSLIAHGTGLKPADIPGVVIDLKRALMLLKREIKERSK